MSDRRDIPRLRHVVLHDPIAPIDRVGQRICPRITLGDGQGISGSFEAGRSTSGSNRRRNVIHRYHGCVDVGAVVLVLDLAAHGEASIVGKYRTLRGQCAVHDVPGAIVVEIVAVAIPRRTIRAGDIVLPAKADVHCAPLVHRPGIGHKSRRRNVGNAHRQISRVITPISGGVGITTKDHTAIRKQQPGAERHV